VLGLPQFGRLVNMRDRGGDTALHLAVKKCNPKMVAALLLHPDIDVTVLNNKSNPANYVLPTDLAKTLNWVRMFFFSPRQSTKAVYIYIYIYFNLLCCHIVFQPSMFTSGI
jgi:hypothetical protein